MRYLIPLLIKYFLIAFILALLLPFWGEYGVSLSFITAIPLSIITYLVGDIFILPRAGNVIATILNTLIAGLVIWGSIIVIPETTLSWTGIIISIFLIGVNEWFFHHWLVRNDIVFPFIEGKR